MEELETTRDIEKEEEESKESEITNSDPLGLGFFVFGEDGKISKKRKTAPALTNNNLFECGKIRVATTSRVFEKISHFPRCRVKQISSGKHHTLFLTYDGEVFGSGKNLYGQIGIIRSNERFLEFEKVTGIPPIKSIHCKGWSSFFVTWDDRLLACGYNDDGRLVLPPEKKKVKTPTEIEALRGRRIKSMDCTIARVVIAFETKNKVYVAGQQIIELPFFAQNSVNVKKVTCGDNHTAILSESGDLYLTGSNEQNQIGSAAPFINMYHETRLGKIKTVSCAQNYTVAINDSSQLYICGATHFIHSELFITDIKQEIAPWKQLRLASGCRVRSLFCSSDCIFICTDRGLFVQGDDSNGKLGIGTNATRSKYVGGKRNESGELVDVWSKYKIREPAELSHGVRKIGCISIQGDHTYALVNDTLDPTFMNFWPLSRLGAFEDIGFAFK